MIQKTASKRKITFEIEEILGSGSLKLNLLVPIKQKCSETNFSIAKLDKSDINCCKIPMNRHTTPNIIQTLVTKDYVAS